MSTYFKEREALIKELKEHPFWETSDSLTYAYDGQVHIFYPEDLDRHDNIDIYGLEHLLKIVNEMHAFDNYEHINEAYV